MRIRAKSPNKWQGVRRVRPFAADGRDLSPWHSAGAWNRDIHLPRWAWCLYIYPLIAPAHRPCASPWFTETFHWADCFGLKML